jgi:hypothetical protein
MANEFLVSVADAILRDPNSLEAIAYGRANITSAFTLTMQKTDVRGGINNPLLYQYIHDRALEVKIEEATFSKHILALNAGNLVVNDTISALQTDCIDLTGGSGNLSQTPEGNVSVVFPNTTVQTVGASGSTIWVSGGGNQSVYAIYTYAVVADSITIESTKPPSVVDLTLIAEVRDNSGVVVDHLQIHVPRFQVAGNYTLSFAANGVSSQALEGNALLVNSSNCSSGDYYATVAWISTGTTGVPITAIAATPSPVTFSVAAGLPATKAVTVIGIRGGGYSNKTITTSCSFTKNSGCASLTCGANTGIVSASATAAASHTATFTATYYDATSGSLTDNFIVNVVA